MLPHTPPRTHKRRRLWTPSPQRCLPWSMDHDHLRFHSERSTRTVALPIQSVQHALGSPVPELRSMDTVAWNGSPSIFFGTPQCAEKRIVSQLRATHSALLECATPVTDKDSFCESPGVARTQLYAPEDIHNAHIHSVLGDVSNFTPLPSRHREAKSSPAYKGSLLGSGGVRATPLRHSTLLPPRASPAEARTPVQSVLHDWAATRFERPFSAPRATCQTGSASPETKISPSQRASRAALASRTPPGKFTAQSPPPLAPAEDVFTLTNTARSPSDDSTRVPARRVPVRPVVPVFHAPAQRAPVSGRIRPSVKQSEKVPSKLHGSPSKLERGSVCHESPTKLTRPIPTPLASQSIPADATAPSAMTTPTGSSETQLDAKTSSEAPTPSVTQRLPRRIPATETAKRVPQRIPMSTRGVLPPMRVTREAARVFLDESESTTRDALGQRRGASGTPHEASRTCAPHMCVTPSMNTRSRHVNGTSLKIPGARVGSPSAEHPKQLYMGLDDALEFEPVLGRMRRSRRLGRRTERNVGAEAAVADATAPTSRSSTDTTWMSTEPPSAPPAAAPTHRAPPPRTPRRPRAPPPPPMSAAELARLTNKHTKVNEAHSVQLETQVRRLPGPRPPSPSEAFSSGHGRRAQEDFRPDSAVTDASGAVVRHARGAGDDTEYTTPPGRGVHWDKRLVVSPTIARAAPPTRGCLAQVRLTCCGLTQKSIALDAFGNIAAPAPRPPPRRKVIIKRLVYDGEDV